jgi:hypothetical protein
MFQDEFKRQAHTKEVLQRAIKKLETVFNKKPQGQGTFVQISGSMSGPMDPPKGMLGGDSAGDHARGRAESGRQQAGGGAIALMNQIVGQTESEKANTYQCERINGK